ncbi:hypothetical protein BJ508DRAFT_327923 [Ascobolus immersus RN42]|uniref:Uncharacterized protein n=1 Tax=Ascobolus immersus RN42 TaxID=1160509 RepID=A0A3N4I186_ASCIM|nr:hypothetical protein BJ508DRAFT_327923 [Ascobolus immersus RN42]
MPRRDPDATCTFTAYPDFVTTLSPSELVTTAHLRGPRSKPTGQSSALSRRWRTRLSSSTSIVIRYLLYTILTIITWLWLEFQFGDLLGSTRSLNVILDAKFYFRLTLCFGIILQPLCLMLRHGQSFEVREGQRTENESPDDYRAFTKVCWIAHDAASAFQMLSVGGIYLVLVNATFRELPGVGEAAAGQCLRLLTVWIVWTGGWVVVDGWVGWRMKDVAMHLSGITDDVEAEAVGWRYGTFEG